MKLPIQINGKTVEIELTSDQIAQVKKETSKITERIKTEKDVYKALGYDKDDWEDMHVFDRIAAVAQILNEGWKPDWSNSSEGKYVPYFKWNGSAFVFYHYISWSQDAVVGSRLCFKNSEMAIYAAKQFIDLYNEMLGL